MVERFINAPRIKPLQATFKATQPRLIQRSPNTTQAQTISTIGDLISQAIQQGNVRSQQQAQSRQSQSQVQAIGKALGSDLTGAGTTEVAFGIAREQGLRERAAQKSGLEDQLAKLNLSFQLQEKLAVKRSELKREEQKVKKSTKKPSASQSQAAGFASRIQEVEKVFSNLGGSGFDPTSVSMRAQAIAPRRLQSAEFQQFDQASRNLINSILRRESGAAISESEFANANQQYIPQPGDKPEVLAQKQRNRILVFEALSAESRGEIAILPRTLDINVITERIAPKAKKSKSGSVREELIKSGDITE